jgi:uncharacterized membrane-anchored protein
MLDGQLGQAVAAHYDSTSKKLNVEKVIRDTKKKEFLINMVDEVLAKRRAGITERSTLVRSNIANVKNYNGMEQDRITHNHKEAQVKLENV